MDISFMLAWNSQFIVYDIGLIFEEGGWGFLSLITGKLQNSILKQDL